MALPENFVGYQEVIEWARRCDGWPFPARSGEGLAWQMLAGQGFNMEKYRLEETPNLFGWLLVRRDG